MVINTGNQIQLHLLKDFDLMTDGRRTSRVLVVYVYIPSLTLPYGFIAPSNLKEEAIPVISCFSPANKTKPPHHLRSGRHTDLRAISDSRDRESIAFLMFKMADIIVVNFFPSQPIDRKST
jgi:hypothetical protein